MAKNSERSMLVSAGTMLPHGRWSARPFARVSTRQQRCVTQRKLSARARGASSTLSRPSCQHRRYRPSPSHGCSWSGVSTWPGLSRKLLVASPTCSSRWTSSLSGLRLKLLSSSAPKKLPSFSLTSSTVWCAQHHHHGQWDQLHGQEVLGVRRPIQD
jgi:hypothetical protein